MAITTRETTATGVTNKGSPLTNAEVDTNFIELQQNKVELDDLSVGTEGEPSGDGAIAYDNATGVFTYTPPADISGAVTFEASAGEALTKGDAVYVSGVSGNKPVVSKADADDSTKMAAFGLAEADASLNAAVNVVTFGTLYNLDTSGFSAGDTVYVSTTAGELTATKPSGESSLIQNIGKVVRSHATAGSIKVGGAGRTNDVPNLNDGNVFIGNSSNQAEARALVEADISDLQTYLTAESDTLDSVTDRGATTTNAITVGSLTSTGIDDNATANVVTVAGGSSADKSVTLTSDQNTSSGYYVSTTGFGLEVSDGGLGGKTVKVVSNGSDILSHNQNANKLDLSASESVEVAKLGVNEASPDTLLHLKDADEAVLKIEATGAQFPTAYDGSPQIQFAPMSSNGTTGGATIRASAPSSTFNGTGVWFEADKSSGQLNGAYIGGSFTFHDGNGIVANISSDGIEANSFRSTDTGAVEAFTIDSTGATSFNKNLAVDTDTLFVDQANARVGVNNATPSVELHVKDSNPTATTSYTEVKIESSSANNRKAYTTFVADSTGEVGTIGGAAGGTFLENDTGACGIRAKANGDVGLYTNGSATLPDALLKSNGEFEIAANIIVDGYVEADEFRPTGQTTTAMTVASTGALTTGNDMTVSGSLTVGDGTSTASHIAVKPADDTLAEDIQFYNGTTRIGEIGTQDTTWLRINQETAKNIYTPRYIRADGGFFVDGTSKGINGSGDLVGSNINTTGTVTAGSASFSGNLTAGDGTDKSMSATSQGQIQIDGNGYDGAITLDASAMYVYHNSSSRNLVFGTNETERMKIAGNSGTVYVGGTGSGVLQVNGASSGNEGGQINLVTAASQGTYSIDTYTNDMRFLNGTAAGDYQFYKNSNAGVGATIFGSGKIQAVDYLAATPSHSTQRTNGLINYLYNQTTISLTRGGYSHHVFTQWSQHLVLTISDSSWTRGDIIDITSMRGTHNISVTASRIYTPTGSYDTNVTFNATKGTIRFMKYSTNTGYWMVTVL